MTPVEDLLEAVREYAGQELPHFTDCVRHAFRHVDAVFHRRGYGEFFFQCASSVPDWLPTVVLANADAESQGSEKLFWLWRGSVTNRSIADDVLIHARDEARHSRVFLGLVSDAFPTYSRGSDLRRKRDGLFKVPSPESAERFWMPTEHLMDHLVQMNMGEIRTRAHMLLLAPVIYALTASPAKRRVEQVLTGLVTDEVRHIAYTARFIEGWCLDGDAQRIGALYKERLADFHLLTIRQTEATLRSYGLGRFPELLEI